MRDHLPAEGQPLLPEELDELELAVSNRPEEVELLTTYGSALTAALRFSDAEGVLQRAVRLAPREAAPRLALAILQFRRGLYAEAEVLLASVVELDPTNAAALYYRGESLHRLGRVHLAVDSLQRSLELDPYDPRAFRSLGVLYDRQNLPDRAAEMYSRARALEEG